MQEKATKKRADDVWDMAKYNYDMPPASKTAKTKKIIEDDDYFFE